MQIFYFLLNKSYGIFVGNGEHPLCSDGEGHAGIIDIMSTRGRSFA